LIYDSDGGLLIGTSDQGLWRYGPRRLEQLDRRHGLHGNRVVSLLEDREGDVWIGSADGLYQLRDLRFSTIDGRHGIGEGYVRALWEQPVGTLWIGSTDGLYRREGESVQRFGREQGLPNESILSLAYSPALGLLVGTFGGGLAALAEDRAVPVPGTAALASLQIRAMLAHSDGSLWIASNSGLFHLRGQQLTRYGREDGLPRDFTMALSEGAKGELWIGSSGGLVRFDGQQFQTYGPEQGLQAEDVFSVLTEASGELWIGSNRGLKHYAQGRFRDVPGDDPAFNTSLFQILKDRRGDFWISSNRGIFLLSGSELAAVRAGRTGPVHVRRHDRSDGMSSEQANGASQPAGIRMSDGSLRVATALGAVVVTPERRFPQRAVRLDPIIESVYVDGEDTALSEGQRLPAGTRRVEFRYVGLSLLAPERLSYRHRLLGFDDHWVDAGNQRLASYTNLAPGSYRFEIEAASAESAAQGTSLQFSIEPFWWQRRSTLALAGILALSLMILAWRRRTTQLRRRSAELERLVDERTRDLQTTARDLAQADQDKNLLVEQLREQAEAFERQAREDWLTGLPNRRAFEELLRQQIRAAAASPGPLCVALADIDHFKDINDRHSHATGDQVLIAVAEALRQGAGAKALIARWGGEEFMLLFPDCTHDQALQRCEQLRAAIASRVPFFDNGAPQQVTLSFGVAEYGGGGEDSERLLSQADRRLYQAKDAGRNCVR
jgi:diguanylate cyclase (GGDEF)-like protein